MLDIISNSKQRNNNNYIVTISDGELLVRLEYYKNKLKEEGLRQNPKSLHGDPTNHDRIKHLKALLLEVIKLLEEIGYDCSRSRSLL